MKTVSCFGAAVFAMGLTLAGPQAIAVADRGNDAGSAGGSTQAESTRNSSAHADSTAPASHSSSQASMGAAESVSVPEVSVELAQPEVAIGPDVTTEPEAVVQPELTTEPEGVAEPEVVVDPVEPEVEVTAEPEVIVDPVEPEVTAEPEVGVEPGSEPIVIADPDVEAAPKDDSVTDIPVSDGGDPEDVELPVVVFPGRGGPYPLPWWRSVDGTDPGSGYELGDPIPLLADDPIAVPDLVWANGSVDDPTPIYTMTAGSTDAPVAIPALNVTIDTTPTTTSGPETATPGQFLTAVRTGVAKFFDEIGAWLSTLPPSPFSEFLSGVLLLVRRGLVPLDIPMTTLVADDGTSEGTAVGVGNPSILDFKDITPDISQYWQGPTEMLDQGNSEIHRGVGEPGVV